MCTHRFILSLLFVILLAGCSTTSAYDIDVTCLYKYPILNSHWEDEETTMVFTCIEPDQFEVRCISNTVQKISDAYLCTTRDQQKVRIKLQE